MSSINSGDGETLGTLEQIVLRVIERETGHQPELAADPFAAFGSKAGSDFEYHLLNLGRGTLFALVEIARELDRESLSQ